MLSPTAQERRLASLAERKFPSAETSALAQSSGEVPPASIAEDLDLGTVYLARKGIPGLNRELRFSVRFWRDFEIQGRGFDRFAGIVRLSPLFVFWFSRIYESRRSISILLYSTLLFSLHMRCMFIAYALHMRCIFIQSPPSLSRLTVFREL